MSNSLKSLFGIILVLFGVMILAVIPLFYLQSKQIGDSYTHIVDEWASSGRTPTNQTIGDMKLIGKIDIPKLSLTAPIVEGTAENDLKAAVGHLSNSVVPGQRGTAILAAHNITWFRHIDRLQQGDTIQVQSTSGSFTYRVTGSKIVRVGYDAPNTKNSSIVLEACYPLDTWSITYYRYLVYANLIKSDLYTTLPV